MTTPPSPRAKRSSGRRSASAPAATAGARGGAAAAAGRGGAGALLWAPVACRTRPALLLSPCPRLAPTSVLNCRGSYLYYTGSRAFQQVMAAKHTFLHRQVIIARAGSEPLTPDDWARIKARWGRARCDEHLRDEPAAAARECAVARESAHALVLSDGSPACAHPRPPQKHGLGDSALGSVEHGDRAPDWLIKWTSLVGWVGEVWGRMRLGAWGWVGEIDLRCEPQVWRFPRGPASPVSLRLCPQPLCGCLPHPLTPAPPPTDPEINSQTLAFTHLSPPRFTPPPTDPGIYGGGGVAPAPGPAHTRVGHLQRADRHRGWAAGAGGVHWR